MTDQNTPSIVKILFGIVLGIIGLSLILSNTGTEIDVVSTLGGIAIMFTGAVNIASGLAPDSV